MELEEILEVVKEKYPEADIDFIPNTEDFQDENEEKVVFYTYNNYINKNLNCFEYEYSNAGNQLFKSKIKSFDNIIELKHYLDIEIKWEDLVEYVKNIEIKYVAENFDIYCFKERICLDVFSFYKEEKEIYVGTEWEGHLYENRSYWQMYNIIKNLVE